MLVVQIFQLPLFFKMGYTKARFLSLVPFAALMAGYAAFMGIARNREGSLDGMYVFLSDTASNGMAVPIAVLALALIVCVSYCLSVIFYRKREF
jgi:hypothetical protein